jgi:hypothetical protein
MNNSVVGLNIAKNIFHMGTKGSEFNTATSHTKSFHINWLHIHFLASSLMDNSSVFA